MERAHVTVLLFLIVSVCLLVATSAGADTLRCGSSLISKGDYKYELVAGCGEPSYTETYTLERSVGTLRHKDGTVRRLKAEVRVDEWTYNFGPSKFVYLVRLENGRIVSIKTIGRGFVDRREKSKEAIP